MKAVTLISTTQFDRMIEGLLSAEELAELEFSLATDPVAHPLIPHGQGVRKARWKRQGMGKRGGIRVIYFYAVQADLLLLIAAYAKNVQGDLTNDQKTKIRKLVRAFEEESQH